MSVISLNILRQILYKTLVESALSDFRSRRAVKYSVYILRTTSNKLYIGHTGDIAKRLQRHAQQDGALLLRTNEPFQLVYSEVYPTRLDAIQREHQLKGWTRAKKEALI